MIFLYFKCMCSVLRFVQELARKRSVYAIGTKHWPYEEKKRMKFDSSRNEKSECIKYTHT